MSSDFKKYVIQILVITLAIGVFVMKPFHTFDSIEKTSHETLVIGLQSGYPPFEFMDVNGEIVGFDIDVAELIAEKLGKTLVIKDMEFEAEILSLKQGKIDLIVSGMNITPSRLKEIFLVPYHGESANSFSLMFWKEIPQGVHSIEDIANLPNPSVSVQSGAVSETHMNRYLKIHTKSFLGALGPLIDVKYGKSVANLVEPDVAEYLKRQHPEIKILDVPVEVEDTILGFGIGINKKNTELFQKIQQIIQELKASGKLQQLDDKWFKGVE